MDQKQGFIGFVIGLALLALAGIAIFVILTQPDFLKTAKFVPPLPTFNDCSAAEAEIAKYDWDVELATAVMKAESQCDASAHGDEDLTYYSCGSQYENDPALCEANQRRYGYSVGLFQVRILEGRESCDTYDVATNVACAYEIYLDRDRSFDPWSGYTTGKYQWYLWHSLLPLSS